MAGTESSRQDRKPGAGGPRTPPAPEDPAGPRVAFIGSRGIPATYGGVERYVEELSVRLAGRGYRVAVYCRAHYAAQRGTYRGVELRHLPCLVTKHLEAITHTVLATLHVLWRGDEIVHYMALGPSLLAWLPRLFGRKTVVTVQGLDWQRRKWGRLARGVLKLGEWTSARAPHRTIVVSNALRRYYKQRYPASRPEYIANGTNPGRRAPVGPIEELGLQSRGYLLFVGRLVPEKRVDTLITAFRKVQTDKKLVIVGGSSHTEAHVRSLRQLAEGANVLFTGYRFGQQLRALFTHAYLFVTASELEGLPLTLLEAMSHGLCTLVSDIEPHLESLPPGSDSFKVGDEFDLAEKLRHLLTRPAEVQQKGQAQRAFVEDRFGWEAITEKTRHVYSRL